MPTLRRSNTTAPAQGYRLRPTNTNALSQVSTEELLLELRRRIIAPRDRRQETWDTGTALTHEATGAALTRTATDPNRANSTLGAGHALLVKPSTPALQQACDGRSGLMTPARWLPSHCGGVLGAGPYARVRLCP